MKRLTTIAFLLVYVVTGSLSFSQTWSGIVASSRAIDWSHAGLPATLPDGETTPNPWTPPTRTQCGSTITSGASVTTINTALAACGTGTYVLLGAGTFTVTNAQLRLADTAGGTSHSGTSLRGSGPNSTKIVLVGSAVIVYGNAWSAGTGTWTSGFTQGATSLGMTLNTGAAPSVGELISVSQCDTNQTGAGCVGTRIDNGGVYLCGGTTSCANQAGNDTQQSQTVLTSTVTNTGGSNYTITFTPGLYMPNWAAQGGGAFVGWTGAGSTQTPSGIGLEALTVDMTGTSGNFGIQFSNVYASWIKGVRIVGTGSSEAVDFFNCKNSLIANSLIDDYSYLINPLSLSLQEGSDSDNLVINNILLHGLSWEGLGSNEGDVIAYNLIAQTHTLYYEANPFQHTPGNAFTLYEGNSTGHITDDDTWGSANLNTFFRNYLNGADPPYLLPSSCSSLSCIAMKIDGYHRFSNIIGNVIYGPQLTSYEAILSTPTNGVTNNACYRWSADTDDPLTLTTAMRWGNVCSKTQASDTPTNSGIRFVSSEVPTSLSGNAIPFQNSVPGNTNLPGSFFMSTTAHPSGGTGLSWWKVCTSWSSFPTSCSGTQTNPFPAVGPEVTGGNNAGGFAYDIPAAVAFNSTSALPIDTTYQNSYAVTGYSWATGTETITVTGLPTNSAHIMGGFQITGATGACNSAAGTEFVMTGSSPVPTGAGATTITYLVANPGACSGGNMKFPDVRQFDESVFQNDPLSNNNPSAPSGAIFAMTQF